MTRFGWFISTYLSTLLIGASACVGTTPKLIWNITASTPVGLYALESADELQVNDIVAVKPPETVVNFLADGGYLPKGVPLLKQVLALSGQVVCRKGRTITVNGTPAGEARDRDNQDRDLPVWQGCLTLAPDEIFLMNRQVADSFDGRYFGPLPVNSIIGHAVPLWTAAASESGLE